MADKLKEKKPKITKDMTIGDVVKQYPEAVLVMLQHGLHCIGCHVSYMETVEQGAAAHGMKKKEIDEMIKEMNEVIEE
jgi:hybrid cluster-associated redox disulfide protein